VTGVGEVQGGRPTAVAVAPKDQYLHRLRPLLHYVYSSHDACLSYQD
jgi:hypothetical protein